MPLWVRSLWLFLLGWGICVGGVHLLVYGMRVLVYLCSLPCVYEGTCLCGWYILVCGVHVLVYVYFLCVWKHTFVRCTCNYACICITQWLYILDCSLFCILWQDLSWPCELLDLTSLATSLPLEMPFPHLYSLSTGISGGLLNTIRQFTQMLGIQTQSFMLT